MLEELCKSTLFDICKDVSRAYPLVRLRGYPQNVSPFEPFFGLGYAYNWSILPVSKILRQRKGGLGRLAWVWFNEHSEDICNGYFKKRFNGNVERAMIYFGTFELLFADFKNYFEERKKDLMERTENALQKRKSELAQKGEKPQSYGGVANLLKVLAKTSQEQGSSIQTIAKVQYAVCMQAGIFIPDEFLTDVMTATNIMDGADNG